MTRYYVTLYENYALTYLVEGPFTPEEAIYLTKNGDGSDLISDSFEGFTGQRPDVVEVDAEGDPISTVEEGAPSHE